MHDAATEQEELLSMVTPQDVLSFGLIPELIGRLPIITPLLPLDVDQMVRILTEPKNAIVKQYQHLFELEGAQLEFTQDALQTFAEHAMERGTGARALRAVIDGYMLDLMFDLPDMENAGVTYVLDRKAIESRSSLKELARRSKTA